MLKNISLQVWLRMILVVTVILFCLCKLQLAGPFLLSLIFTLVLWPVVNIVEDFVKEKCKISWFSRWMAIIPVFIVFSLILTFIFNYIFVPFVAEFSKLINNVPLLLRRLMGIITFLQIHYLNQDMPPEVLDVVNQAILKLGNHGIDFVEGAITAVVRLASVVIDLLIVPILTFYLLKDGRLFVYHIQRIFNAKNAVHVSRIMHKSYHILGGYVRAELVLAINMFIIVFISMTGFGVSYPLVLALLAAVAEWIPIVGPILAALVAIAMASLVSLNLAAKVAIFYLIVQIIDGQIIKPKVFGSFFHLHPIVIISVVFIFGSMYGVLGMTLAVPGTALAQIIANEMWNYNKLYKGEKQ